MLRRLRFVCVALSAKRHNVRKDCTMNVAAMFVLGLLMGWLAEWTIDWVYWRGRIRGIATENTALKECITSLEAMKNQRLLSPKNVPLTDVDGNDNFQAIKGIGPVFAKRLKESGVTTFDQLSKLKSKQLEEILGTLYKRFFSKQETILAQAKEFAKQKAQNS
jgi:predicted flap endonuclease-1-like 5' DNA nuclease